MVFDSLLVHCQWMVHFTRTELKIPKNGGRALRVGGKNMVKSRWWDQFVTIHGKHCKTSFFAPLKFTFYIIRRIEILDVQWHAGVHGTMVIALWWALLTACVGEDSPPVTGQHGFRSLHLEFQLHQSHQKILEPTCSALVEETSLHWKAFWIRGNFNPGFCDTIKRKGTMIERCWIQGQQEEKAVNWRWGDRGCKLCLLFVWGGIQSKFVFVERFPPYSRMTISQSWWTFLFAKRYRWRCVIPSILGNTKTWATHGLLELIPLSLWWHRCRWPLVAHQNFGDAPWMTWIISCRRWSSNYLDWSLIILQSFILLPKTMNDKIPKITVSKIRLIWQFLIGTCRRLEVPMQSQEDACPEGLETGSSCERWRSVSPHHHASYFQGDFQWTFVGLQVRW